MTEEQQEEDENKRIRPRERALGQKISTMDGTQFLWWPWVPFSVLNNTCLKICNTVSVFQSMFVKMT